MAAGCVAIQHSQGCDMAQGMGIFCIATLGFWVQLYRNIGNQDEDRLYRNALVCIATLDWDCWLCIPVDL